MTIGDSRLSSCFDIGDKIRIFTYPYILKVIYMPIDQQFRDEVMRLHAQICGGLADPTRILILYSLADQTHSVGDLAKLVDLSQPTVSRHLKVLRERNLVQATREGNNVYYSLTDRRVIEALDLMRAVMADHLTRQANLVEKVSINL
jgi:DNA-binding transcriptional ArsR family regulator